VFESSTEVMGEKKVVKVVKMSKRKKKQISLFSS
jgi:hypothetical protein